VNDTPDIQPGKMIAGRYREIERIGSGGMSVVVKAEDTTLKRIVAVKLLAEHLADDADFVTRFRHEALAVARLQHPNIVQVFDSGADDASGRQFIVMEFVEGTPLSDHLRGGRKVDVGRALAISSDACEALECAHRAGVIHRDVKPANLIIAPDGSAKLADFGIAKQAEMTRVTQVGSVLGTVAYLSPEQAVGGETGPQSDIYSLAVVTYEMLGGRLPYEYKSITELAMKQRDETPAPLTSLNPEVSVEIDRTIRVALSHDPALRFPTAREFAQALRQAAGRRESEFVTAVLADPEAATRMIATRGRRTTAARCHRRATKLPRGFSPVSRHRSRPTPLPNARPSGLLHRARRACALPSPRWPSRPSPPRPSSASRSATPHRHPSVRTQSRARLKACAGLFRTIADAISA
jgi:serine/threonine protein kinase